MDKLLKIILYTVYFIFTPAIGYAGEEPENARILCQYSDKKINNTSADYVAGIDVYGNPVTPADLGTNNGINFPVIIPIEVDLAERYGLNLPLGIELKPEIAQIEIFSNGDIKYNGKNIENGVHDFCAALRNENIQNNARQHQQEHGHKATDSLPSDDKIEGQYPDDDHQDSTRYND